MPLQQLPMWIQVGTFLLAVNAGMINVLGLFTVLHQAVSHMTGNISLISMALLEQNFAELWYLLGVIVSYVLGSFYSGLILGNAELVLGRRYGIPLSLVALSILLCWIFLPYFPRYGLLWAAVAMGIQNAMVSHYRGTIIRTTHLSGVLTDLGLAFGYLARGLEVSSRRIVLHLLIVAGFLIGGLISSVAYPALGIQAFLIPVILSVLMSLVYWLCYFKFYSQH